MFKGGCCGLSFRKWCKKQNSEEKKSKNSLGHGKKMTENERKTQSDTHTHTETYTLTRALSFLCLYYWCRAHFVPTRPSVLDSPTLCPLCFMPNATLAGWHKQINVVLSKCECLINIPQYLGIGDRWNIPKETWGEALICPVLGWLPKHGLICGVRSNHVMTTWAVNRIGIRVCSVTGCR